MRVHRAAIVATTVGVALCMLTLLAMPKPAHACSCARSGSPKQALKEADGVFLGRVTSMMVLSREAGRLSSADPVFVEFKVARVWKGPRHETLTVETERMGLSCGFEFAVGRRYVVYAYDGYTGLCTRTAPMWLAARDFAALGLGQSPASALPVERSAEEAVPSSDETVPRGSGCTQTANGGGQRFDSSMLAMLAGMIWLAAVRWRRK